MANSDPFLRHADFPLFYHYRKGASDRRWIEKRMSWVPESKRFEVSREYERLYKSMGRKQANEFIHDLAKEYREARKGGSYRVAA